MCRLRRRELKEEERRALMGGVPVLKGILVLFILLSKVVLAAVEDSNYRQSNVSESLRRAVEIDPYSRLTLNVQDADIHAILQILAAKTGRNILVAPGIEQRLTLHLKSLPLEHILEAILLYADLEKTERNGVIFISPRKDARRLRGESLETAVIQLNYAEAGKIAEILFDGNAGTGLLLSEKGNIRADERTNKILVQDRRENIQRITEMIQQLDHPVRQVEISGYIVAAFDDFARDLGVSWGLNYSRGEHSLGGTIDGGFGQDGGSQELGKLTSLGVKNPHFSMAYMVLGRDLNIGLELSAMQSEGRGEILSNPVILTTDRQKAYIKQGSEVAYSRTSNDGTNTEFKEVVMELNVVPKITPDNRIILDLLMTKDEISGYAPSGEPIIGKRALSTQALIKDGETLVLGGIYEHEVINITEEVPFLGRLPFVGNLFKRKQNRNKKAELLIFVTPRIIDTLH